MNDEHLTLADHIVLASGSPRRKALLGSLQVNFEIEAADINEDPRPGEAPDALVKRLSREKAQHVAQNHSKDSLIIAADTLVVLDGEVLSKPVDAAENLRFVRVLSARAHQVFTGYCLLQGDNMANSILKSKVRFRNLSEAEMHWYVATQEGLDKAGGYAIQDYGSVLVESIEGCYFNVVGLSLSHLVSEARRLRLRLF